MTEPWQPLGVDLVRIARVAIAIGDKLSVDDATVFARRGGPGEERGSVLIIGPVVRFTVVSEPARSGTTVPDIR